MGYKPNAAIDINAVNSYITVWNKNEKYNLEI